MNQKELRTTFGHPTPELPVADVERAQEHYRDTLGFEIGWLYPGKEIGAVSRDNSAWRGNAAWPGVTGTLTSRNAVNRAARVT